MTARFRFIYRTIMTLVLASVLTACGSRYHIRHDKAPLREPTALEMQDAIVTNEKKKCQC